MVRNNKKLAFIAFASIQSALMLGSSVEGALMPGIEMPIASTQRLADHAAMHAVQAQHLADSAAHHASAARAMAKQMASNRQLVLAERRQLEAAINTVKTYLNSPNPKNGTLKKGIPGATYQDYKQSVEFIKAHASQFMGYALGALLEVQTILEVLPKVTVEDQTIQAELNMAINALRAVLKKQN